MLVQATQMSTKVAARLGGKLSDVDSSRLQGSRSYIAIIHKQIIYTLGLFHVDDSNEVFSGFRIVQFLKIDEFN